MRILIVGGGIGGLTAGLALKQAGHDPIVFESAPDIRPLGVGINLLPHAVRELTRLGLAEKLNSAGVQTAELAYFNKFGQLIWREPRGLAAGYRWPQYSIHRGSLQMILLQAARQELGADNVRTGCHLADFQDRGGSVQATFTDRRTGQITAVESGAVLIGADGIHSVVRRQFYPDEGPPRFSGQILWRAITSHAEPYLSGRSMVMIGHSEQKFVAYPICPAATAIGRPTINWIAELAVRSAELSPRDWNRKVEKSKFAARFATWRFDWLDVPKLIDGATEVYEYPMSDRDPIPRWSFGRVTLLGDAAHPMYPIGSNGASQAILDAAALADVFADATDPVAALRHYEQRRIGPTSAIVTSNRGLGPEVVMKLAEDRAPNGFTNLSDVFAPGELEGIARQYKQVAGFDPERLNQLG